MLYYISFCALFTGVFYIFFVFCNKHMRKIILPKNYMLSYNPIKNFWMVYSIISIQITVLTIINIISKEYFKNGTNSLFGDQSWYWNMDNVLKNLK